MRISGPLSVCLSFLAIWISAFLPTITTGKKAGTRLSGFGARSSRKTIFPIESNKTKVLSTPQTLAKSFFSQDLKLLTKQPKLWVRRSRDTSALWLQTRDEDDNPIRTIRIRATTSMGGWEVEESRNYDSSKDDWAPIEGIYGYYALPSGIVWVLITKTEPVYSAPPLATDADETKAPWWNIRRVSNFELVHLDHTDNVMSEDHLKEEVRQLRLLRLSLKEHKFYYVPRMDNSVIQDMTQNLQTSLQDYQAKDSNETTDWWDDDEDEQPDSRFFWNKAAVDPIMERYDSESTSDQERDLVDEILRHVIPVTSAFVGIQSNVTDPETGLQYDQLLVSRRSRFRAGTRFTRRGADASGAVANFAETEQIVLALKNGTVDRVMSHVQTRGSIPLRWSSPADVKTYRPRVRIGTDPLAQARALRLHLLEQFSFYVADTEKGRDSSTEPKLVFVNLIDKKKDQGRLGQTFDSVLNAVMEVYAEEKAEETKQVPARPKLSDLYSRPKAKQVKVEDSTSSSREEKLLANENSVKHIWFDFHAEVKDGRWHRLSSLLEDLEPTLKDHGYFLATAPSGGKDWTIESTQKAIVRTNCMDCLDRTNVVQSLFGRYMFFNQMAAAVESVLESHKGEFTNNPLTIPWEAGETAHRLLWADNADEISRLYAGTPALKGDFTRTGQRTKKGALDDGMNSLQRYYLNNFLDADRQEGMDLLVGYVEFSNMDGGIPSPLEESLSLDIGDRTVDRSNSFGSVIQNMIGNHDSSQDSSEETGPLDLRWIPGDLQSHVLSQTDTLGDDADPIADTKPSVFGFSPAKALAAIDRRAASDLPWWVPKFNDKGEDSSTEASDTTDEEDSSDLEADLEVELPVTDHQRYPRIPSMQLLALLLVGYRSPSSIATAVVSLLLLIFLPALLKGDLLDDE